MTIQEHVKQIAAYDHLASTGELRGNQKAIMAALISSGKATSGEVLARLGVRNVNAWRARFTELSARGLIAEIGERKCSVTGKVCVVWQATGRLKPLSRTKGARTSGTTKQWRDAATLLYKHVMAGINKSHPAMSAPLERYRKLAGLAQ
jgi:hypothetical protein